MLLSKFTLRSGHAHLAILSPLLFVQLKLWLARTTRLPRTLHRVQPTASPMQTLLAGVSWAIRQAKASPTCAVHGRTASSAQDWHMLVRKDLTRHAENSLKTADWAAALGAEWKQVTLQYLDTNNQLVNIQVAVPSESCFKGRKINLPCLPVELMPCIAVSPSWLDVALRREHRVQKASIWYCSTSHHWQQQYGIAVNVPNLHQHHCQ